MIDVRENCRRVLDRMNAAAVRSGRSPSSVRLIAVTKTVSAERIRQACECGISDLGENKLQEALSKIPALSDLSVRWHFIGRLQSNKAKKVVETFQCVQSVDRWELAEKLNQYATAKMPILVEVNLGGEDTKSGVAENGLQDLVERLKTCQNLELRGLMAIPPFHDRADDSRPYFARLRGMKERLGLNELSMGMSHDFEVAVEEGATMIRVGTALFGARG